MKRTIEDNGNGTATLRVYSEWTGKLLEKRIVNTEPCAPVFHRTTMSLASRTGHVSTFLDGFDFDGCAR